jgi:hypothetical protein
MIATVIRGSKTPASSSIVKLIFSFFCVHRSQMPATRTGMSQP